MTTLQCFPHAHFLSLLETSGPQACASAYASLPPPLWRVLTMPDDAGQTAPSVAALIGLLSARAAVLQASFDTAAVADELRRYQKFARPGQPSPHIVQLRQQQGAVRLAASRARQSFVAAAVAFVRDACVDVPARSALEAFAIGWIEAHVPQDVPPRRRESG